MPPTAAPTAMPAIAPTVRPSSSSSSGFWVGREPVPDEASATASTVTDLAGVESIAAAFVLSAIAVFIVSAPEEAADADGRTPLYVACEVGDFEAVHLLCERGADHEHATLSTASRPLFAAAHGGHLEIVKYLASAKRADLNYRNKRGVTPCLAAYDRAHMDVVAFLETLSCQGSLEVIGDQSVPWVTAAAK